MSCGGSSRSRDNGRRDSSFGECGSSPLSEVTHSSYCCCSSLMRSSFALVIAISVGQSVTAYVPIISSAVSSSPHTSSKLQLVDRDDDENEGTIKEKTFRIPNPLAELGDILSNWDDVVDDFFNKRMGNGEVFYGKRKYKPSGRVDSDYNGGGFSDWRKMEAAREFREERAMMRALRGETNINEKDEDDR